MYDKIHSFLLEEGASAFLVPFLWGEFFSVQFLSINNFVSLQGGRLIGGWEDNPFKGELQIVLRGNHSTPEWALPEGPNQGSKVLGMCFQIPKVSYQFLESILKHRALKYLVPVMML